MGRLVRQGDAETAPSGCLVLAPRDAPLRTVKARPWRVCGAPTWGDAWRWVVRGPEPLRALALTSCCCGG